MLVEFHLFRTRPLERCLYDSEEIGVPQGVTEAEYVIGLLNCRICKWAGQALNPVQGYAFVNGVPAVLIRSDGSVHFLDRYRRTGGETLEKMRTAKALAS